MLRTPFDTQLCSVSLLKLKEPLRGQWHAKFASLHFANNLYLPDPEQEADFQTAEPSIHLDLIVSMSFDSS